SKACDFCMSIGASTVAVWQGPKDYRDAQTIHAMVAAAVDALVLPADFVRPGDHVVLKPNWVKEHDERHPGPDQWEHVVTHPSVIESVIAWVAPQMQNRGGIIVCDAPQTDSSFATLRRYCDLDAMIGRCRTRWPGLRFELL